MAQKIRKNIKKIKQLGEKTGAKVKQTIKKHPRLTAAGKHLVKLIGLSIILFSLFVFIYVIFNYETIEGQAKEFVGGYGYTGMFVVAFLVDMLFQPLGPELPLVMGLLSGLNPFVTILLVTLGSTSASYLSYSLGKKYGELGIRRLYSYRVYNRWSKYYNKYGRIAVSIAALTPLPYVPFCWFSGILNMKARDFLLFAILPRVIRIIVVSLFLLALK